MSEIPTFNFLERKRNFVIQLGQYISHEVIRYRDDNNQKHLKTEEEVNELDRINSAYDFYENYVYGHYLEGGIPKDDFTDMIALYLDIRIPQTYLKWKYGGGSPSSIDPNDYEHSLIHHFESLNDVYKEKQSKVINKANIKKDPHN